MSNRKHPNAYIKGWMGPLYFTPETDTLNQLNSSSGLSRHEKNILGKRTGSFKRGLDATSTDGYQWYHALEFATGPFGLGLGRILVAFPWKMDASAGDDKSSQDRSIAVYTRHQVSEKAVRELLTKLIKAFERPFETG